jgi:predicted membrane-bound spermidine synthase
VEASGEKSVRLLPILGVLFFLSGTAALIYQVCWQRILFAGMGSDTVSIAIIVSVFMLGLGLGGLLGGWVADRYRQALLVFVVIELLICGYGLASAWILESVASRTALHGEWVVMWLALMVLVIPTTLMGMTLPILVIQLDRVVHNVGRATGFLYCVNTLGAALGAFLTGLYLFDSLDLIQATWLAAGLNSLVACGGIFLLKRWQA